MEMKEEDLHQTLRELNRRLTACETLLIGVFRADREGIPLRQAVEGAISEMETAEIERGAKRDASLIARDILYKGTITAP